jgi:hypothetical protein
VEKNTISDELNETWQATKSSRWMPEWQGGELLHFQWVSFPFHPYLVKIACISDRTRVFPKTRIGHWCVLIDI